MVDIHLGVKQIIRVNKKRGVPIRKYFEAVKKMRRTQMHGLPIRKYFEAVKILRRTRVHGLPSREYSVRL